MQRPKRPNRREIGRGRLHESSQFWNAVVVNSKNGACNTDSAHCVATAGAYRRCDTDDADFGLFDDETVTTFLGQRDLADHRVDRTNCTRSELLWISKPRLQYDLQRFIRRRGCEPSLASGCHGEAHPYGNLRLIDQSRTGA